MGRIHIDVATPALALRRAEAAAALSISVEVFDQHVRHSIPAVRVGGVVIYPVAGIAKWLEANGSTIADDIAER